MMTNKLLPGKLVFKPSLEGVSTSRESLTLISRSSNSLAKNLRRALLVSTALAALIYSPDIALAFIIENGTTETVIGTGGGTQASPWTPGTTLALGNFGDGTLNISAGGTVHALSGVLFGINNNVNGTLNLTGGSFLNIGNTVMILGFSNGATGTLSILGGSTVTGGTGAGALLGRDINSQGIATVSGAGSSWIIGIDANVGENGEGILNITDGGVVDVSADLKLGRFNPGTGILNVSGANSQLLVSGALVVGAQGQGGMNITNGGLVTSNDAILGVGINATGAVTVTGTNSRWEIGGGDAFIGEDGTGILTIAEGSTVTVDAGIGNLQVAQGNGSIGTVNIGAAANGAAAASGTINASTIVFGPGTGRLVFNITDTNHVFGVDVDGAGTIENVAGTTTLTGNYNTFTGNIEVTGGTLNINADIAGAAALNVNNGGILSVNADLTGSGAINVNSGGTLGGSGTLSSISVLSGGTLAPGNSIGTLNIAGNASLASGSTYSVEINSAGSSDLLNVGGILTISNGASVAFSPENGTDTGITYTDGQVHTIATATGGVNGTFGSITDNFAFLSGALTYNANNVLLTITRDADFITVAQTSNQIGVATAAQALGSGNGVFDALVSLSEPAARNAFDQLTGEVHTSAKNVFVEDSRYLRNAALTRLMRKTDPEKKIWGKFYGGSTSLRGDTNVSSIKGKTGGLIAGYDAAIDNWRFGSAAQIGRTSFSVSNLNSSGTSTDYGVSLYGSSEFSNATWAFGGAYTRHRISTNRTLAFGGLSESLSGRYDASTFQVFSKFSYGFTFDRTILTPFAEVDHVMHKTNSFSETGGAAAITSSGDTLRSTFVTLGLDAVHKFSRTAKLPAIVHGTIGWRHAFNNENNSANSFANGQQYAVDGAKTSSNAVIVKAGVDFSLSDTVGIGFNYNGQFGTGGNQVHAAKARISAKF